MNCCTASKGSLISGIAAAGAVMIAAFATALTGGVAPEAQAEVGKEAPNFTLTDLGGEKHALNSFIEDDKVVVLEWFNPGCPFVQKHYEGDANTMNDIAEEFKDDGVVWLRINSGAPGKQGHGVEKNKKVAEKWDIDGPILVDEDGKVGRAYGAKRTPEMFIIDREGVIRYHGAIDDNPRPSLSGEETNYVREALREVLAGETVSTAQTRPYGCSVKYSY